jgi:hypothetical protein
MTKINDLILNEEIEDEIENGSEYIKLWNNAHDANTQLYRFLNSLPNKSSNVKRLMDAIWNVIGTHY